MLSYRTGSIVVMGARKFWQDSIAVASGGNQPVIIQVLE